MAEKIIQWFPGHMAKAERQIKECLSLVDCVIEIADARIPYSSRNPDIDKICKDKPRILVLSKASLADPEKTSQWVKYFECKHPTLSADFVTGENVNKIPAMLKELCEDKLKKWESKGLTGKNLRVMVLGIPNSGKSSFINRISKKKKAKVEDRPGVTRENQWVVTDLGFELLDTPGVLWPKFSERRVAENLALTKAIKDEVLDREELAVILCDRLKVSQADLIASRYKLNRSRMKK